MKNQDHILVIEDDVIFCNTLSASLKEAGFNVTEVHDGPRAIEEAKKKPFELIISDIRLAGKMDGIEVCQRIRANKVESPIMMLTAKSEEIDKVLGLEVGADDYLTKPFSVREFIARVKAIFRRQKTENS